MLGLGVAAAPALKAGFVPCPPCADAVLGEEETEFSDPASDPVRYEPLEITYNSVPTTAPFLALTFDDGPHGKQTPRLLDLLAERNLRATFYVIGMNVAAHPEITRRIVEEGHEIANHTWSHPQLSRLSMDRVTSELQRTHDAVLEATGVECRNMRPPYGAVNERIRNLAREHLDYTTIMWSVDPMDWKYRNADRITRELLAGAAPGAILLCHDIHAATVDAMPATLDGLLAKGFHFATVSDLVAMEQPHAPKQPADSSVQEPA